eukprot:TRINITY_DN5578_c0_g1_i1.p1 TRINITY_DN5578_c0_g1~~TRINITY_DN5578_c0_g1_i1.p1  ORF type:complete len:314 (+),score=69.93 TRINITY_DN5578_c0_g1_i1:69-1010(+)
MSVYAKSADFKHFKSWVAMQRVNVETESTIEGSWKFYDYGPKEAIPLIILPGITGTAESFYPQFLALCPRGLRIISVQWHTYTKHDKWVKGFDRFLDILKIDKVHLFGTSLGGYLAQCFIQFRPNRVVSLVLCNSFSDTQFYVDNAPCSNMFAWMPEFMLKRLLLSNFPSGIMEKEIANSVDFMVEQLETLTQRELASRMTLNCTSGPLKPTSLDFDQKKITIIDTMDEVAIPDKLREEVYKFYPKARVGQLKEGGNFPYLSRADEVNMHLTVHLRKHGYALGNEEKLSEKPSEKSSSSDENEDDVKEMIEEK